MAEGRIREMPGDGADIEARTPKAPDSDVRNGPCQLVKISSKNGAASVSITRRDGHAKANAHVQLAVPFGNASTEAMTNILMSPTIAILHRRNIGFGNGTDPDSGEFPDDPAYTKSDSRSRAIRNAADGPRSRH
jgi:hypothetical protein